MPDISPPDERGISEQHPPAGHRPAVGNGDVRKRDSLVHAAALARREPLSGAGDWSSDHGNKNPQSDDPGRRRGKPGAAEQVRHDDLVRQETPEESPLPAKVPEPRENGVAIDFGRAPDMPAPSARATRNSRG